MKKRTVFAAALLCLCLLLCCGASADGTVTIPDNTTAIQAQTFYGDQSLDAVILPEGMTSIGSKAFAGSSLKTIYLPESITSIADDAFEGCATEGWGKDGTVASAYFKGKAGLSFKASEKLIYDGELLIWVSDGFVDYIAELVAGFKADHPGCAGMTVIIGSVGEQDTSPLMRENVENGADLYCFPQDQVAVLVAVDALSPLPKENAAAVRTNDDAGAVSAATMNGTILAYPLTSDNGYFLYYDRSVITDPSSLEQIMADCEAADKLFAMEITSGSYQPAFFFGAGCDLTYSVGANGAFTGLTASYASEAGVKALKTIRRIAQSAAFANRSWLEDAPDNIAAIVDGTWDKTAAMEYFGENYAAAKLPKADGCQLVSFSGNKLLGVKPQSDANKLAVCHALAAYLTSETAQIALYSDLGWLPSNKTAQSLPGIQDDAAISALLQQAQYSKPQGQYPVAYWEIATALANEILDGALDDADDAALLQRLTQFEDDCRVCIQ